MYNGMTEEEQNYVMGGTLGPGPWKKTRVILDQEDRDVLFGIMYQAPVKNRSLILFAERVSQKKPEGRKNGADGRTDPENRAFS